MTVSKITFYIILAIAILAGAFFYSKVIGYVVWSLIVAYLLDPAVTKLQRMRVPRWLGVLIVYLVIMGLMVWLMLSFVPDLLKQGQSLMELIQTGDSGLDSLFAALPFLKDIHKLLAGLDSHLPSLDLAGQFKGFLSTAQGFLSKLPTAIITNFSEIIGTLSYIGMVPFISFFLLKDKVRFRKAFVAMIPNRYFELVMIVINKIDETVGRYMRAMLFEVIAVALMSSFALGILGVPYSILIGVVAGIANIIPYFGPILGGGVAVLTVVFHGFPPIMILWVALAMYLVQLVDNNIVFPMVVGKTIDMHHLIVLLTVLAGGWFGGILWMLLSVPIVYMSYSVLSVVYKNLKDFRLI